ncbi:MAG: choice-of-anchor tandem repeat GloVer-containing protein, partial [Chitinophagaceae bacterium]
LYGLKSMGSIFKMPSNGSTFTIVRETNLGNGAANQLLFNQTNQQFYAVIMGGPANGGALISYSSDFNSDKYIYGFNYYHEGAKPTGIPLVISNEANPHFGKVFGNTLSGFFGNGLLFSAYTQQNNQRHQIVLPYTSNFGYSSSTRFGLIMGSDGYLYGCMENGGGEVWGSNLGSVFRVNPADTSDKSIIKYFNSSNTNSYYPIYLIEGTDGFLYGISRMGGNNNRGTLFKIKKDGSEYQNIYQVGGTNSLRTVSSLIYDAATQLLIGTGTNNDYESCIFTINTNGNNLTIIKTFLSANTVTEGAELQPTLSLVGDTLFGAMLRGGNSSLGSIFKLHKNGSGFSTIKLFSTAEVGNPLGALQIDDNDFIYGTCSGSYNNTIQGSAIFKLHKSGNSFSLLKQFTNNTTDANGILPGPVVLVPCTTPNNASNIRFGRATNSSITITGFDAPASGGANGYIVKINAINYFTPPNNGSIPTANTNYTGSGEQVVFAGNNSTSFTVNGLMPNTTYWFKVFAYGCTANLYSNTNTTNNPNSIRTPPIGIGNTNLMARFDGVNDAVIADDIDEMEGQTAISFGGWVKPFSFPQENFALKSFIAKGDAVNAANTTLQAGFMKDDGSLVNVQAMLNVGGILYKLTVPVDSSMFRINTWSHYFISWQTNQPIKLYINGRLVAQTPLAVTGNIHNTSLPLRLGSSNAGANEKGFHGDMEEVQLYNGVLGECSIRQRMHILLTGNERNLVSYFQFNENNSITTFNDYVGNHHGTKQNGVQALPSDLSAGTGKSDCFLATSSTANYFFNSSDFSNGIQLLFPGMIPNGLMNISYIESAPVGGNPNPGSNMLPGYWIINNYGSNTTNLSAQMVFRFPYGTLTDTSLSNYRFYKRHSNGSGNWEILPITAVSLEPGNNSITINNIPSFSQFVLTSASTVLPMELVEFKGEIVNNRPVLQWTTANDTNMDGYIVERQTNSSTIFDSIAFIVAKNQVNIHYTYQDNSLKYPGIYTYRLKMQDKDGTISWSKTISLKIQSEIMVQLYPNPASNEIFLTIPAIEGKIAAKLIGINGQIVGSYLLNTGKHKILLQHLPKGIYQLIFSNNKQIFTPQTLIKL